VSQSLSQLINGELQLYKSWYTNNEFLCGTKFEVATFLPGPEVCGTVLTVTKEDLHKLFCCLNGFFDVDVTKFFDLSTTTHTRGHSCKLYKRYVGCDVRKRYFSNTIIKKWNNLPSNIIEATTINDFKNKFDNYFKDLVYCIDLDRDQSILLFSLSYFSFQQFFFSLPIIGSANRKIDIFKIFCKVAIVMC